MYGLCSIHTESIKVFGCRCMKIPSVWVGDCDGLLHWVDQASES